MSMMPNVLQRRPPSKVDLVHDNSDVRKDTVSKILTQSTLGVGGRSHSMGDAWGWLWPG